ncbi:MAG: helix-turn-helix domain-containing protein [Planctomycetota bacterium]|nr:helix-turn-helix domain-containing protein [Planctomycetota bacterium]
MCAFDENNNELDGDGLGGITPAKAPRPAPHRYDPIREQFYTCEELADILGILPESLAKHARLKRLPACQPYPSGPWFFPKDEMAAYLRKRVQSWPGPILRPLKARKRS